MPVPVPGRVAEALRRSTVQVLTASDTHQGNGSGVVLTDDRVITNAHVIRGRNLTVESWEGKRVQAAVSKMDRRRDLALLTVSGLQAPAAVLGDSDQLRVGTAVIAVGNPLGFTGAVSSGIVHQIGPARPLSALPWIHADVRLAPGNSGGPLADFHGQILGINTMVVAGGLALSIPSRAVQLFLSRTAPARSLGVTVRPVQLRNRDVGMMILEIESGSGAEAASLLPGDILAGANGARFRYPDDLQAAIEEAPGGLLRLDFYRAEQYALRHVTVRVAPEQVLNAA